jgi:hypothetical protein
LERGRCVSATFAGVTAELNPIRRAPAKHVIRGQTHAFMP